MNLKMDPQRKGANHLEVKDMSNTPMNTVMAICVKFRVPAKRATTALHQGPSANKQAFLLDILTVACLFRKAIPLCAHWSPE